MKVKMGLESERATTLDPEILPVDGRAPSPHGRVENWLMCLTDEDATATDKEAAEDTILTPESDPLYVSFGADWETLNESLHLALQIRTSPSP